MVFAEVDVADGRRVNHHIWRDGRQCPMDLRRLFQVKRVPREAGSSGERIFSRKRVNFPIGGRLLNHASRGETAAARYGQFAHVVLRTVRQLGLQEDQDSPISGGGGWAQLATLWGSLGRFRRLWCRLFCLPREFEFLNLQLQLFELLLDVLRLLVELLAVPRLLASIPIRRNQHAADRDEIKEGDGNL